MGGKAHPRMSRASFSLPSEREWIVLEHSEGVYFAESATHRIGPFPAEAAHREAVRQNESELIVALAEAMLAAEGGPELDRVADERRFVSASERRIAAAIAILYERGEYDGCEETEHGPVVLVSRFLALFEPSGVALREFDTADEAEANLEVLREGG